VALRRGGGEVERERRSGARCWAEVVRPCAVMRPLQGALRKDRRRRGAAAGGGRCVASLAAPWRRCWWGPARGRASGAMVARLAVSGHLLCSLAPATAGVGLVAGAWRCRRRRRTARPGAGDSDGQVDVAAERGDGRGGGAANAGGCLCRRLWSAMAPCAAWPEGVADAAVQLPCAAGASMPSGEAVGRYHGYNS